MKLVSIITINYNNPDVTNSFLQSILKSNHYPDIEILVVDNASTNNPIPVWELHYPMVTFIRSEKNLGFAGGNNLGMEQAKGDYFFLINNDTEVTENLVSSLVSMMEANPMIGIVSPKILYFDQPDTLQYAGYTKMNFITGRNHCIGQFEKDNNQYRLRSGKTGYIHGAAMMISRSTILKVGLMVEDFFLYYEELDWCERIKKAGYETWVNTNATIYHKESMSVGINSPLKEYYMNRNRILFMRRHSTNLQYSLFLPYFLFVVAPRNIGTYLSKKQYKLISPFLKALTWNFLNNATNKNSIKKLHSSKSIRSI